MATTINQLANSNDVMLCRDLAVMHHKELGNGIAFDSAAVCYYGRQIANSIERTEMNAWLARNNDQPIGYLFGTISPQVFNWKKIATQHMLYVIPSFRGSSTAIRLIKSFELWAKENFAVEMQLNVERLDGMNEEAERISRFYSKLGYKLTSNSHTKTLENVHGRP
jgi:GNAT superfamily N-acetyltransferase